MKKFLYIYLLISFGTFSGCSDFLDKNPPDQLSSDLFWSSNADFENALTAIYATLQNGMLSSGMPNWDALTDNGYGQHNYWGSNAIVQGNIFPSSGGYISDVYYTSYRAITRVNIFLDQLANYDGEDISIAQRDRYIGEAKFFRGYFYFLLYHCYGEVPIVTEPLTLENQIVPKSGPEEVKAQIMSDLTDAQNNLPTVNFSSNGGHVVKSSVDALMARVLLNDGYESSTSPRLQVMDEVRSLLESVMDAGYSLDENYSNVFRDGTQEGNPEIIFSIKFLAPNNFTAMDQWYGDWIVVSPLQNLLNQYESIDGLPIDESPLFDPSQPFVNRDPRMGQTIFNDFVDFGDGMTHAPSNNRPTGFGVKKFLSPDLIPYGYATRSQQDWVLFRYADVLLMYAEVVNEIDGPQGPVYSAINAVRERVGMPPLPEGLGKEEMRERIRHERRIELAFEGLRYYDLKRWKIANEVLNNVEDGIIPYNFEEKFYHWPLPQSEIDRNQGTLVQNPDY